MQPRLAASASSASSSAVPVPWPQRRSRDRDGQHVRLGARGQQPGVADDHAVVVSHQIVPAVGLLRQFAFQHLHRPRFVAEELVFQPEHRVQVGAGHAADRSRHDGVTRFGRARHARIGPAQVERLSWRDGSTGRHPFRGNFRELPGSRITRRYRLSRQFGVADRALARCRAVLREPGGSAHGRSADAVPGGRVTRPVDLLAPRVGGDDELAARRPGGGLPGDHVQAAHPVQRDVQHAGQHPRGHQADPQAGVRARAGANSDRREVGPGSPRNPPARPRSGRPAARRACAHPRPTGARRQPSRRGRPPSRPGSRYRRRAVARLHSVDHAQGRSGQELVRPADPPARRQGIRTRSLSGTRPSPDARWRAHPPAARSPTPDRNRRGRSGPGPPA